MNTGRSRSISILSLHTISVLTVLVQTIPLTQDAYMVQGGGINFGTATPLNVGGPNVAEAPVQFDLSTLPTGTMSANVSRPTLMLFIKNLGAAGNLNVSEANGSWTELGTTAANAPVPGAAVATGAAVDN